MFEGAWFVKMPDEVRDLVRQAAVRMRQHEAGIHTQDQRALDCGVTADLLWRLLGEAEPEDDGGC